MPKYTVFREVLIVQSCEVEADDPQQAITTAVVDDEWEATGDTVEYLRPNQVTDLETDEDFFF